MEVTLEQLREKHGKRMVIDWQKMCNFFGFDPAVTVAFEIEPITKEIAIDKPNQISGPVPPPTRPTTMKIDLDGDGVPDVDITPIAQPKKEAE